MDRLIEDIKKKIKRTKGFWTKLPQTLCTQPHVSTPTETQENKSSNCWNGTHNSEYDILTLFHYLITSSHDFNIFLTLFLFS
jgi:hypothetical protein